MSELKELFEMTTKQIEPDVGSWREQESRQRKVNRNRKGGAFAVAAAIVGATLVAIRIAPSHDGPQPANSDASNPSVAIEPWVNPPVVAAPWFSPSAKQDVDFLIDLDTGETTPLPRAILRSVDEGQSGQAALAGRRYAASPGGAMLAFASVGDEGGPQIFIAGIDGTGVRQLTYDPIGATSPAWSPDGNLIAYIGESLDGIGKLYVVDVATGASTRISNEIVGSPQFMPDGTRILYAGGSTFPSYPLQLRTMPIEGGESTPLFGDDQGIIDSGNGSISPDGSLVTFLGSGVPGSGEVDDCGPCRFMANADGTNAQVIPGWMAIASGTWSPDGSRIVAMEILGQVGHKRSLRSTGYHHEVILVVDVATEEATIVANGGTAIWLNNHTLLVEA